MKLRKLTLLLHRYIGLLAGLLVVILGITGSLLVFEEELNYAVQPDLFRVPPQSISLSHQTLISIAQQANPTLKPQRVTVPQKADAVYLVEMVSSEDRYTNVYLNPYSGEILGQRLPEQTLTGFLFHLHVQLFAGNLGGQIVGFCGIALLAVGITGTLLWRGWRKLAQGFKIRWNAKWQVVTFDLHNVGGILSALLLSLIAFTGAIMVFGGSLEAFLLELTRSPSPPEFTSTPIPNASPLGIDQLLQKAQAAVTDARIFRFYPSRQPEATFDVWMELPHANEFKKDVWLFLDQYSGNILNPKDTSWSDRFLSIQYPLHVGHYGGLLTKVVYFVVGLVPLGLLFTGFILFQQRRWTEARRKTQQKMVSDRSA